MPSDAAKAIIDAAIDGNAVGMEDAVQAELMTRITDLIDHLRPEVAKTVFEPEAE